MRNILKKTAFFIFLSAFVAVAVAFFYFDRTSFDESDLRLEIIGPEEVSVGEEMEYRVRYRNNSDIRLENVSVIFEYPETSVPLEREEDEIIEGSDNFRKRKELPDINPGQEEIIDFSARAFGEKGDAVEASAWFSYSPQNLSANYEISRSHTGIITEIPLTLEFVSGDSFDGSFPDRVEAGQDFSFGLYIFSDLDYDIGDLGLRATYPSGFEFISSSPEGIEDNEWEIESLGSRNGTGVTVSGILEGEPGDTRGFQAELGVWRRDRFIPIKRVEDRILIPSREFFMDVVVNDDPDYVADPGDDLLYDIYFKNLGEETIENLFLRVDLDTDMIDEERLETMQGMLRGDTIIWNHSSTSQLRRLGPEEEEKVSFMMGIKEDDLGYNPEIRISAEMNQARRTIQTKVNTDLEIMQNFMGEDDPFRSSGPLPLNMNQTSTYTISWEVGSSFNDVEDVEVNAELPEGATIINSDYPEETEFEFDSETGEIIWKLESLERGTGISRSAPKANFQVEFTPDFSVEGDTELISEAVIRGTDTWTDRELEKESGSLLHGDLLGIFEIGIDDEVEEIEFEEENQEEDDEDDPDEDENN